jgi:hypothetical protein
MTKKILMALMALFAACILVVPAFSMPNDGTPTSGQNCDQTHSMMGDKMPAPQGCPCDKPAMGPDGKQMPPMMKEWRLLWVARAASPQWDLMAKRYRP